MDELIARALHAARRHLADGGSLLDLFSGPDYMSNGKEASFANMPTQDETNADFFKADRAMRLAQQAQARDEDVTGSVTAPARRAPAEPTQRPQIAAAPPAPAPSFRRVETLPGDEVEPHEFPAPPAPPAPQAAINNAVSLAQNVVTPATPTFEEALANVERLHNAGIYSGPELDKAGEVLGAHLRARDAGTGGTSRDTVPLSFAPTEQAAPAPASAPAAIVAAMPAGGKLTDRAAAQPGMTDLTPQQADYIIRTIAAESSGHPEESQGIANVIMNRINSGRFGANPEAVLFSKNQFEPWSNKALANYPLKIKPGTDRYTAAAAALDAALQGSDNTGGATFFWGPGSQYALGRKTPKWARDMPDYSDIGATRFHREGRADGGETYGDGHMRHEDIVAHALHALRRHFDGSDGSFVVPTDDAPEETQPIEPRRVLTPAALARAWTPPEETASPRASEFMQTYPEKIAPGMESAANAASELFKYPGQVLYGERSFDPHSDEDFNKAMSLAMLAQTGGIGGVSARAGETVLGSGPVRKAASNAVPDEISGLFDYSRLHEVPKVQQFDLPRNIPPRGVPERVTDLMANQDVRDQMIKTIGEGRAIGGPNWYNTDPLREKFIAQLGEDAGGAAHRKYMDFVAATSPRSKVGENARNASYYYGREMRGEGMPAVGERNPQPFGHYAQRLHQMNAERVAGSGWEPLNNPKVASFVENLVGNQRPATVDTHALRLPAMLSQDPRFLETAYQASKDAPKLNIQKLVQSGDMSMEDALKTSAYWQAYPKPNEYAALERYYQGIAKDMGMTPAQTQASAWIGGGKMTGLASDESKPFLRFFDDRVMKTARETGMDPKDVLRDFISGKAPLYAKGGSVEDRTLSIVRQ
jgi:hypothetical protein